MHTQAMKFVESIKDSMPQYFNDVDVFEVGSQNINGTVRNLFKPNRYLGVDLYDGRDVDWVGTATQYIDSHIEDVRAFHVSISTEVFEHDKEWRDTFMAMYHATKLGGLVLFTCATTGRSEHGTRRTETFSSPGTIDYYKNLDADDFYKALDIHQLFDNHEFRVDYSHKDLYFWGIKHL